MDVSAPLGFEDIGGVRPHACSFTEATARLARIRGRGRHYRHRCANCIGRRAGGRPVAVAGKGRSRRRRNADRAWIMLGPARRRPKLAVRFSASQPQIRTKDAAPIPVLRSLPLGISVESLPWVAIRSHCERTARSRLHHRKTNRLIPARFYRDLIPLANRAELDPWPFLLEAPELPSVPHQQHGYVILIVREV